MKLLSEILEGMGDDREAFVTFADENCFGLADFEMVDESIYESLNICLSNIVSKVRVDGDVYAIGNKLEFSVCDVVEVVDAVTGVVLYQKKSSAVDK